MNRYSLIKVVRKFNKIRKPECYGKTVKNENNSLLMEFSGSTAPYSCCFDEHFNDFSFMLEEQFGVKFIIEDIKRRSLDKFLVSYKIFKQLKKEV